MRMKNTKMVSAKHKTFLKILIENKKYLGGSIETLEKTIDFFNNQRNIAPIFVIDHVEKTF